METPICPFNCRPCQPQRCPLAVRHDTGTAYRWSCGLNPATFDAESEHLQFEQAVEI